jgi:hypothetical protein
VQKEEEEEIVGAVAVIDEGGEEEEEIITVNCFYIQTAHVRDDISSYHFDKQCQIEIRLSIRSTISIAVRRKYEDEYYQSDVQQVENV